MTGSFANERARAQVERILSHVSFPGLGLVVDRDGRVVAAQGSAPGTRFEGVEAFGAGCDAVVFEDAEALLDGLRVSRHELPAGYALLIAVPCEVTLRTDRVERAVGLLARMLVVGGVMGPGSPGDSGSGAPALVGLDPIIEH